MFAGVAGGLGEYFGVDPILFRLGFAFLALLGGAGVALYIAAWLLVPEEGEARSLGEVGLARATRYAGEEDISWIWITALVIGGIIVISNLGRMGFNDGAWFWAVLLIAGGVWLYRQDNNRKVPAPTGFAGSEGPGDPTTGSTAAGTAVTRPLYAPRPAAPHPPAPPKPPPSRLGRYTFAVTLVVLGIIAMLDNSAVLEVSGSEYAAVALTTVGIGLLIGSVAGRSRGLIFWGLLLIPLVMIGSHLNVPITGGIGEEVYAPVTAGELAGDHELFVGSLTLDLADMQWDDRPVEVEASVFMGQIEVFVPDGVDVRFSGHAQMGALELFGLNRGGTDVDLNRVEGTSAGPQLVLDTRVVMGKVDVNRTGTPAKEIS